MFPEIYHTFLQDDDPFSKESDWKNLFNYKWSSEEEHFGYALIDGARIVGILGTMFSERVINGSVMRFCNLHSWIVEEKYRAKSLLLLRPILNFNHTITDFSPSKRVISILKRLGFNELGSGLKILLPCASPVSNRDLDNFQITQDTQYIENKLNESDLKICHDHLSYKCNHLLIYDKRYYCYLIYSKVVRHWMPYCYIHYISNKDIFAKVDKAIRLYLLKKSHTRFLAVDSRLLPKIKLPFSFNFPLETCQLYKSPNLKPDQIDALYSELTLLNLTTFPDLSAAFRTWFHDHVWSRGAIANQSDHAFSTP